MNCGAAVRVTAARTMILLDPELAPPGKPSQETPEKERQGRMPSVRALAKFLREAQAAVRLRGAVSVLLTTDGAMRRLNRRFRGRDTATDVLSFPAGPVAASQRVGNSASQRVVGDLAVSVDRARRQASEQGHALAVEVKVLMLHGLLHLAGYDHETDEGQMARRERVLRARLGLPLGLIERAWIPSSKGSRSRRAPQTAGPSTARSTGVARSAQDDKRRGRHA
jgi:probable rRNA maturation factor